MSKIYHILAVDPGKATGIAFMEWEVGKDPVLVASYETTIETFASIIRWALSNYPDTLVFCEKFTITVETAKKSPAPYSSEHIGMLRLMMMDAGRDPYDIKMQLPADAKKIFPNTALRKLGYWHRGGAGHALDGIRHALLGLVSLGWVQSNLLD